MASTSADIEMSTVAPEVAERTKLRDMEISKIFKIVDIIVSMLGVQLKAEIEREMSDFRIDLDTSDEISGVLMTVFTCLRKGQGDEAGVVKYRSYKATVRGVEISIAAVVDQVKNLKIELDFMICTPIVEIMTLFRAFFDEVRTGVTRFRVRKGVMKHGMKRDAKGQARTQSQQDTQTISSYGLSNQHVPLLQGITIAPERRTGVIRSLGPLTQCILLVQENRYHDKLSGAIAHTLQMLPMVSEIISCLKNASSPGQVAGILKEIGDILLLTTARTTQKFYFPLSLLVLMWRDKRNITWSFSGAPMMKYYTDFVSSNKVTFMMKTGGDAIRASECVFHAMFGTYLDDLGALEEITTKKSKWSLRKDMNTVFLQRSSKDKLSFTPITFNLVSKMAQALLTKSIGNTDPTMSDRPSFSGRTKRNFSQDFLNYLNTGKSMQSYSEDPTRLQFALKGIRDALVLETSKPKLTDIGTTSWERKVNGVWTVDENKVVMQSGSKFFGSK